MVEFSSGTTWTEYWLTQAGTISMNGATPNYGYFPAPGGGTVIINANSGSYYYLHKDWLGSARVASNIAAHTVTADQAYSPYGEVYDLFGASASKYDQFAGTSSDYSQGVMADTPNRELSVVGRWLSPDPAGSGWNQYAYPTNPNSFTDPSGLCQFDSDPCSMNDAHGSQPDNYDFANSSTYDLNGVQVSSDAFAGSILGQGSSGLEFAFVPGSGIGPASGGTLGELGTWTWQTPIYKGSCDNWECGPITLKSPGGWYFNPAGGSFIFASIFYPNQNGTQWAGKNAAQWFMKKGANNPETIPGPPENPDLRWRDPDMMDMVEKMIHGLIALKEQGDMMFDSLFVVMPAAEVCNATNTCGGDGTI